MTLERTLESIEANINAGDLGKARDRLHGLLSSYPDTLDSRKRLGAVYWRLQMPEMAGRYWYLEEVKDLDMTAACRRFEAKFGDDPAYLLLLKFRAKLKLSRIRSRANCCWISMNGHGGSTPGMGTTESAAPESIASISMRPRSTRPGIGSSSGAASPLRS